MRATATKKAKAAAAAKKLHTAPKDAERAAELQVLIAHDIALLRGVRSRIRRIAALPRHPEHEAMDASKRPYTLLDWVICEACASAEQDKLTEDIAGETVTTSLEVALADNLSLVIAAHTNGDAGTIQAEIEYLSRRVMGITADEVENDLAEVLGRADEGELATLEALLPEPTR